MRVVEVKNLSKSFGKRKIINNLSFDIYQGELVALVGKSGCGKSTLLNMIGLLDTPTTGYIRLIGELQPKIKSKKATLLRRNTINYLFQSYALISNLSVRDNLFLAMKFTTLRKEEKNNQINEVLAWLGISYLVDDKVNTLSGGEQQRVALARSILKPGQLILADEPTGSLDPQMTDIVFNLIKEMRDKYGKTIIMVTHNLLLAEKADRIINLSEV
jgi:ABC-type antimicrobial peptide transport system, ATPase component